MRVARFWARVRRRLGIIAVRSAQWSSRGGSTSEGFQALDAQAAAFQEQFVHAVIAGAGSHAGAEAANVAAFTANPAQTIQQDVLGLINAPFLALTALPLIGNGANPKTDQQAARPP